MLALLLLISLACGSTAIPTPIDVSGIQTAAVKTAFAAAQALPTALSNPPANVAPTVQPPSPIQTSVPETAPLPLSGSGDSIQDVSAWPQIPGL